MTSNQKDQLITYLIILFASFILGAAARIGALSVGLDKFTASVIFWSISGLSIAVALIISMSIEGSFDWVTKRFFHNHFNKVTEDKKDDIIITNKTANIYFNMSLISSIYEECNDIQFQNISEQDFYNAINLNPSSENPLKIKAGEKIRVCYLIHKLYEKIKGDNKAVWRKEILDQLEIKESYYKSKYKEPLSDVPSLKSEEFVENIDKIFK